MSPSAGKIDTTLPHPDGASPGLDALIDASQEYLERSVLVLASGGSGSQSDFIAWLEDKGLLSDKGLDEPEGRSIMVDNYSGRHEEITARAAELDQQNQNVDDSQYAALNTSSKAYQSIDTTVSELKTTLENAPDPTKGEDDVYRLSPAAENDLIRALLTAVDSVHDEVEKAADDIDRYARDIDESAPPVPRGGGVTPVSTAGSGPGGFREAGYVITDPDDPVGTALALAASQIGIHENSAAFASKPYNNNSAWCASFTSWLWEEAGYDVTWTDYDYVPDIWKDANAMGLVRGSTEEPKAGDLIIFDWKGDGEPDHIGIVEEVRNGRIHTIEGNSSDMVQRRNYDVNAGVIVGIVKPPPTKSEVAPPPSDVLI